MNQAVSSIRRLTLKNEAFCRTLLDQLQTPGITSSLYVMHNVYVGYTATGADTHTWNETWHTKTRAVLDSLVQQVPNPTIIIALNQLIQCSPKNDEPCRKCYDRYAEYLIKISNTIGHYPRIIWQYTHASLPIMYLHRNKDEYFGVGGAKNLADSDNYDLSFTMSDSECRFLEQFVANFKGSIYDIGPSFLVDAMAPFIS